MEQQQFHSLLARQQELEDHCLTKGAERFRNQLAKAESKGASTRLGAARRLMLEAITPMETAINAMIAEATAPGRKGRRHVAVKWCQMLGADTASYIVAKVLLDGAHTEKRGVVTRDTVRTAATYICELITDELKYRRFRERAKGLFEYRLRNFNTSSYAHMARSLDATLRHAICADCREQGKDNQGRACEHLDMSDLEMPQNVQLQVGYKLIEMFRVTTSLIEIETVNQIIGRRLKTNQYINLAQETLNWMDARNAKLEWQWPVNLPMVVPPLPWGPNERGGYRFAMRGKHGLVRSGHREDGGGREMPQVYEAVNRIQETAWRINPHVLALVEDIAKRGGGLAGVPHMRPEEEPRKPPEIEEFDALLKQLAMRSSEGMKSSPSLTKCRRTLMSGRNGGSWHTK
jgi:DNA-directed RNA polymerase